ncbi:hypothetical protein M426DRAFT_184681 [Hypoxylon sp. CI-4A]|nr:hypothetical protein M426DRAFT_184681 [Hypoxylon sp. CI-4A]
MSSSHILRGPLCRPLVVRPSHIFKRFKFSGRTKAAAERPKASSLPSTPARTRFAPSPTGYVHIGSLRTALYNYLLAKATGGQFLLRIEDTDRARFVPDAERRLYEDLKWAGLSWDEGPDVGGKYGPYKQSERLDKYNKYADQLLNEGRAYRCFCTPKDLDQMRSISIQEGTPTVYNGTCSHLSPDVASRRAANGEEHCVRFKSNHHHPVVNDLVYGRYTKPDPEDDFIIIKRDGYPTYHFANVVDDHLMEITHVIRGAEWLVSTPRHIALYEAFGWQTPLFAHVGLLVNQEKQKLSKRHGDVDIASWRDRGILPITLLNYVMLLGWSLGKGVKGQQEVLDLDEMVSKFNLGFTKGDITVNSKHEFLQKSHVKRLVQSHGASSISNIVLPVLETHVRKYEEGRKSSDSVPTNNDLIAELGPLVPRALPQPGQDSSDSVVSQDYIKKVLEADVQNYKDAEAYVSRNRYLIWQVPDSLYETSLRQDTATLEEIFTVGQVSPDDAAKIEPRRVRRVSELTSILRNLLQDIKDDQWTKEGIEAIILPFLKSIYATPRENASETQLWGYHLLRWIIAASRPGPALIPSMAVLGRGETMKRVEKACKVARSIESEG